MNRGGSFNNTARNARSANRNNNTPENRNNNLGVRPAKATHCLIAPVLLGRPPRRARDAQARLLCLPPQPRWAEEKGDAGGRRVGSSVPSPPAPPTPSKLRFTHKTAGSGPIKDPRVAVM